MPEEYIMAKMVAKRDRMILRRIGPTSGSVSLSASIAYAPPDSTRAAYFMPNQATNGAAITAHQ